MAEAQEIGIPDWVPPIVTATANFLANQPDGVPDEIAAAIERLVTDPRMEGVWHELRRYKRENYVSTAQPFRKALLPAAVTSWASTARALRERAVEFRDLGAHGEAAQMDNLAAAIEASVDAVPLAMLSPSPKGWDWPWYLHRRFRCMG